MSTAVQAAEHIFLSVSRFRDLVAIGTITRAPPNGYRLAKVREEYCKNAQAVMQGREADGAGGLTEQRTRIAAATAVKIETANAVAAGKLCPIADVGHDLGILIQVFHQNLLTMPGKISDSLTPHSPKDRGEIMEIVKRETYDYMQAVQTSAKEITAALDARAAVNAPPEKEEDK
jgi:hypothetical protein